jgi:transposase
MSLPSWSMGPDEKLVLTMKEMQRIEILRQVEARRLGVEAGATALGRSVRTVYRLLEVLRSKGIKGLRHGNKGQPSPRRISQAVRDQVLRLARDEFADVNDTHLRELLFRRKKLRIGRETLRSLLRADGIGPKRHRRSKKYRSRRERKPAFGFMLQLDASPHDWLEGRGPWLTLVGAIDDATNFRWARFVQVENSWAYLDLLSQVCLSHGLPLSLYADKHSAFFVNREPTLGEQLRGLDPVTQFGRAMDELGIKLIRAHSPQAKGRIERQWAFLQDRLVVELRLAGVRTIDQADLVLQRVLLDYNTRFRVAPVDFVPVFRKSPRPELLQRILCLKDTRIVAKDHTVSFEGLTLQIPPSRLFRSIAGKKVSVLQLSDGTVEIHYRSACVARFSQVAVARLLAQKPNLKTELRAA